MPEIVPYNEIFLDWSWVWLNDPEIQKLTLTSAFSKEDQLKFFKNLSERNDYWIKGVVEDGLPIGAMGLKNIDARTGDAEYWGYIGEKNYWGKGIGRFLVDKAIQHAKELNLKSIYLKVGTLNTRAKSLYEKMGFTFSSASDGVEKYILQL